MITIKLNEDGSYDITGISDQKKRNLVAQRDFNTTIKYIKWWIEHCQEWQKSKKNGGFGMTGIRATAQTKNKTK